MMSQPKEEIKKMENFMENPEFLAAQKIIKSLPSEQRNKLSDGYHTFGELYEHRIRLFITLCQFAQYHFPVWRSFRHSDKTRIDGWFVLGIEVMEGSQMTYHLPESKWSECDFAMTFDRAPGFDGHTSADVLERLKELFNKIDSRNLIAGSKNPDDCRHEQFFTQSAVGRLMNGDYYTAEDIPIGFTVDIKINCIECGMPFHFKGVEYGLSPNEPRLSVDGLELRAPIAPGELNFTSETVTYESVASQIQSTDSEN